MGSLKRRSSRRRRHSVKWGRFLLFILLLCALVTIIIIIVNMLKGESPLGLTLPEKTPETAVIGETPPTPTPTPVPVLPEDLPIEPVDAANPSLYGFVTDIMINREIVASFTRDGDMRFGDDGEYTAIPGILTFGGNNYRNTFTYGTQNVSEKKLTRAWEIPIGSKSEGENGTWTGTGWTGMPIIVEWPEQTRKILGIKDEYKDKQGFTEVIYPTMDGKIYFIELSSGEQTRAPLNIDAITKGTASLDPRGYPILYVGQGIPSSRNGESGSWVRAIDLIQNKIVWRFGGKDPFSHRAWQAYDSSPLIHAATDTLIAPGENGVLYTVKLNTVYDPNAGTISISPGELEKYRYKGDGYGFREESDKRWVGIENSIATFRNYAFFTDNGGRLQCLDLNTFKLIYTVDVTDDSDTSIVLEEDAENGTFYLYTANEVDKQPGAASAKSGKSYHRKIDGRTGEILWEKEWEGSYGSTSSNGGTLTTPHVGRGNISDIVIFNATLVPVTYEEDGESKTGKGGRLIAYNKHTGEELWRYEQKNNYWSSPVVIYDMSGNAYLIQGDRNGIVELRDPRTGALLASCDLGSAIESTPAVFGNYLVVGTRGTYGSGEPQKIIGVKIS